MTGHVQIAIFGVGAMACLFASHLVKLSENVSVTLIGNWPEQIRILNGDGLAVRHLDGSVCRHRVTATSRLQDVPACDFVLIMTKSYLTEGVGPQVARVLKQSDSLVLTLQNGIGNDEILRRYLGSTAPISSGVTSMAAMLTGPGQLLHTGNGMTTLAAGEDQSESVTELAEYLTRAGLPAGVSAGVRSLQWGKLAINAAINPLATLLKLPNGALLGNDRYRQVMSAAGRETAAVAQAMAIELPFSNVEDAIAEVCSSTAENRCSMLQDVLRGAPTEIGFISGAVARFAKQFGVAAPVNTFLLERVREREQGQLFDARSLEELSLS